MKKIWQLGLTAFLAVFLLAACGATATPEKPKVDGNTESRRWLSKQISQ